MLAARSDHPGCATGHRAIVPEKRAEAREIRLERIENCETFRGFYEIIIGAKADRVSAMRGGHIVCQLEPGFPVEVGVSAVDPGCKRVGELQMRLSRHVGK